MSEAPALAPVSRGAKRKRRPARSLFLGSKAAESSLQEHHRLAHDGMCVVGDSAQPPQQGRARHACARLRLCEPDLGTAGMRVLGGDSAVKVHAPAGVCP